MEPHQEEHIVIRPPVEIIADEYEHFKENGKIHTHIFFLENTFLKEKVRKFKDCLNTEDFILNEHDLEKVCFEESLNDSK